MHPSFEHVTTWVFDLDQTLYPPETRLFDQIEVRMTAYVMSALGVDKDTANDLRQKYWCEHGTTLAGLMRLHDVDPGPYLHDVHDIDFSVLSADHRLADAIATLPGRKIIYTNGTADYARNVAAARGLSGLFEEIYGVEHADFHPKPDEAAFEKVFSRDGFDRSCAAMFEDEPRNLIVPKSMGLRTIHIAPTPTEAPHIDHFAADLTDFLETLQKPLIS